MKKKYIVEIIFGSEATDYMEEHNCSFNTIARYIRTGKIFGAAQRLQFSSQEAAEAYIQGVEDASGWESVLYKMLTK